MQYMSRSIAPAILSLAVGACASTVQPGLANAPSLGKVPSSDERVTDAVANGHDSCERSLGPGPLRQQVPPCPTVVEHAPAVRLPVPPRPAGADAQRWMEHYWVGWPCPKRSAQSAGERLIAWSPSDLRESHCAIP
jgi:hypothetical protein